MYREVYRLHTLYNASTALLRMRYFRLGGTVAHQLKGAPIGGPASAMCLHIPLIIHESGFDSKGWGKFKHTFTQEGAQTTGQRHGMQSVRR